MGCNLSENPHLSQKEISKLDLRDDSLILVGCDEERIARGVAIIENIIKNCLTVSLFTNPEIVNNNGLSIVPYSSGPNIPITAAEVDDAVAAHAVSVPLFNPRSNPSNDRTDTRTNIDYQLKNPYGIREKKERFTKP